MLFLDIQDFTVNPVIPSSLVGLLGLIAGYVYYYLSRKNKNELEKIKELDVNDRPKYLEQKLNDFGATIDTSDLNPEHKYDLLKRLMNNKLKKYSITAITLVALSFVVYLVWGKKEQEPTITSLPVITNTFSFSSGNNAFDQKTIERLKADSFAYNLNNPSFEIKLISDPPSEPFHQDGSVDRINYYYDSTQVSIEINGKRFSSEVVIPKTGFSPHIPEAKKDYEKNYTSTINQNFETIYAEILQYISI